MILKGSDKKVTSTGNENTFLDLLLIIFTDDSKIECYFDNYERSLRASETLSPIR